MRCVIVGHGPSMLAEPLGELIDNHDFVVRLKLCAQTLNHPDYFGTQTDAVCGSWNLAGKLREVRADAYWLSLDTRHSNVTPEMVATARAEGFDVEPELCRAWDARYREMRTVAPVLSSQQEAKQTSDELGHLHMSLGLKAVMYACALLRPKVVDLIGFDNVATGGFTWSLTRGPEWQHYPDHRFDVESRLVREIADEYRVKLGFILPEQEKACAS